MTRDSDAIDAKRYRFLRNASLNAIEEGGVFAGKTPDNFVLNGKDLDDAIDFELRVQELKGG